ncbi:MAG: MTH1187 family thiamine-binding protein [Acidobacteria bacterium]|nr:MTH1187 family thiamine-binding protein [Acidobacteriota bacterium]
MLAELSIILLGRGTELSSDLGQILKTIDESGIRYRLTPSGTCLEGEWDEVMALIKRCHQQARVVSTHVMTTVRIEDELGDNNKLNNNIDSVERAAGRPLKH